MMDLSEHGTENLGSAKGGNFLTSWATITFPRYNLHNVFR